jgi:hypothetical protein
MFWLNDRKKMHTYCTTLERLEGLKQLTDYSEALMRVLSRDGVEACVSEMMKNPKGGFIPYLSSIGGEFASGLQSDDSRRIKALEAGPYLKEDNPPLWNTPAFNEG